MAANRNESVRGRTIILVVSISTRKGLSQFGAPSGRKWAIDALGYWLNDDRIMLSHIGNPHDKVKMRWLESLNVYGNSPSMLVTMIVVNRVEVIIIVDFK